MKYGGERHFFKAFLRLPRIPAVRGSFAPVPGYIPDRTAGLGLGLAPRQGEILQGRIVQPLKGPAAAPGAKGKRYQPDERRLAARAGALCGIAVGAVHGGSLSIHDEFGFRIKLLDDIVGKESIMEMNV